MVSPFHGKQHGFDLHLPGKELRRVNESRLQVGGPKYTVFLGLNYFLDSKIKKVYWTLKSSRSR